MAIGGPARIVVVDDDNTMRTLLKGVLKNEGFAVVGEASDGQHAIEQCRKLKPDVLCLDVNMPGMSGVETLKQVRSQFPSIKVLMVTADATVATVREAASSGAAGYLIKPFKSSEVGERVRLVLQGLSR